MPPPGAPRPDQATYDSLAGFLETELDRAAAAKPNPGKLPLLHRLSRTEYQNAVRDLLALDALPKEMDYSLLLPPDNASSGFDNIADLLFISPTAMESYLGAAEKISRLAVGDPSRSGDGQHLPHARRTTADRPGGWAPVRHAGRPRGPQPFSAGRRVRHQGGISGKPRRSSSSRSRWMGNGSTGNHRGGPRRQGCLRRRCSWRRSARGGRGRKALEFRIPVKAGPRLIGVTFLERNEARDEQVLRPRMRGVGPQLAVDVVTISGPYNAKGPGDTPSRRRIFVCRPASASEEEPCARRILSTLERRAYRRPVAAADVQTLMPFYTTGRAEGGFDLGIQRAIQRLLVSPQFLFRIERDPAAPGTSHPVSDLELASRLSFFLWSSIPDDELLDLASQRKLRSPACWNSRCAGCWRTRAPRRW